MSVTCQFNGRLGNIVFNMAQVIAYCKRYNLQWWFPTYAWACIDQRVPIQVPNTGHQPMNPYVYHEPTDAQGHPYYHDIPLMDNVEFRGYYQSFRYFEEYRQEILDIFNLPHITEYGVVGVGVRRGDIVAQPEAFPMVSREYHQAAIRYMQDRGYNRFRIYSDDNPWCREEFTEQNYPDAIFEYYEGDNFLYKYISLSQVEHSIMARSTFELTAAWMNQNPNKICICPSIQQEKWWTYQNTDLLIGTENWLTQINW